MDYPSSEIQKWLSTCPEVDGFRSISDAKPFAHEESGYDAQHGVALDEAPGRGLLKLLQIENLDLSHPIMELGCGTGGLSYGLVAHHNAPLLLLTDPSPAFLRLLKRKIAGMSNLDRLSFAILNGDDLHKVPSESLSVVVLRHTLHHIADVRGFAEQAHRILVPGGAFVFEEPFAEALLLMGTMMQFLPAVAQNNGIVITEKQQQQADLFIETIKFYSRQDLDKTMAEDKHLFRASELGRQLDELGFSSKFYSNHVFDTFVDGGIDKAPSQYFSTTFRYYLTNLMGFGEEFGDLFDKTILHFSEYIDVASKGGLGPAYLGVGICRKTTQFDCEHHG